MPFIGLRKFTCSTTGNTLTVFAPALGSVYSWDLPVDSENFPSDYYVFNLEPDKVRYPVIVKVYQSGNSLPEWTIKTEPESPDCFCIRIADLEYSNNKWHVNQLYTGTVQADLTVIFRKSSILDEYGTVIDKDHAKLDDGTVVELGYTDTEIENKLFPKEGDRVLLRGF